MAEATPTRRRMSLKLRVVIGLLLAMAAAGLYLNSASFQERVRHRVVSELERMTGGRVELQTFRWNLFRLQVEASGLTIHGLEPPDVAPYVHVDRITARLKVLSWLGGRMGLRFLRIEKPSIHIIVNPDGSTNQPEPKVRRASDASPVESIFNLAVGRLEVVDGEINWNSKRVPLNFGAEEISAELSYASGGKNYEGKITVGGSIFGIRDYRPLPSQAELQFTLARSAAKIKSFHWNSPSSRLELTGGVSDFRDPKLELEYRALMDLAEVASTLNASALRAGKLDLQGSGKYSSSGYAASGIGVLTGLAWQDASLAVSRVDLSAQYSLDQNNLALNRIAGRVFDGIVQGEASIRNWTSGDSRQQGVARFDVQRLQLGKALASATGLPLQRLHAEGAATGRVDVNWTGSPANADTVIALDIAPPETPNTDGLPVSGRIRSTLRLGRGSLDLAELNLQTPGSRLRASGTLGAKTTQLIVDAEAKSLHEFEPLLGTGEKTGKFPIELEGKATFAGTVYGLLQTPSVRGRLEIAGFTSTLEMPASSTDAAHPAPAPRRIRWDWLGVDLDYSPDSASAQNGALRRGSTQTLFSGRAALHHGRFDNNSLFTAEAALSNAALDDLQSIAGTAYPVTGKLNFTVSASGTTSNPQASGKVELLGGAIYGEPFHSFRSDLRFANHEAQLNHLTLLQNGARITGDAAFQVDSKVSRFKLRGDEIELAHLRGLQSARMALAGRAQFEAEGSGRLEKPVVNASMRIDGLTLNRELLGDLSANAVTRDGAMRITMQSRLKGADLKAEGTVQMGGSFPAQIAVEFSRVDFAPILRVFLKDSINGHSAIQGKVDISGPLREPSALKVNGEIPEFAAEVEKVQVGNHGPIHFSLENRVAKLERFHITGEDTDLTAFGTVNLTGDKRIAIHAEGRANLKLLQGFNPDLISKGVTTVSVTAGGTISQPALSGEVRVRDASLSLTDLPTGLSEINGEMVFNENRLQIQTLTARTGGGTLDVGGFISFRSGLYFDVNATGKEIRLRYPEGVSSSADAVLHLTGNTGNALLSGDVLVKRFSVNPRFDFALYVARGKQPLSLPKGQTVLNNIRLDVHVTTTAELPVETSLAKISGDADLRIRGSLAHPSVLGRINIVQGEVVLSGTKYRLERGDITFSNPVTIDPVLDMEASARVREYDITLGFHGPLGGLSTTYRSDPPLPSGDILALLALGRTREDTALSQQPGSSFTDTASNAVLGQALNAALSNRAQKLFGVSRIKINPQIGGPENATARVTVEQQVNKYITLTYITNVSQAQQQVIQAEFNFTRDTSLVVVRDENGVVGIEGRVRQHKK